MKPVLVLAVLVSAASPGPVLAQAVAPDQAKAAVERLKPRDYPTQPIELVVVYPAGGGMDQTARQLGKAIEKVTGQRFLIANRTGGAGVIGHAFLTTQAKGDGYTVGVVASNLWADSALRSNGRWSYRNLDPLAFLNYDPYTWVVATEGSMKGKGLKEVVALAKEKPGTVRFSMLPGNNSEFLAQSVEEATGARFIKVPFQGGAPGVTAALGGHVDVAAAFYAEYRGHVEAGTVRTLAVAAPERAPYAPDAPTFNEALGTTDILWAAFRYVAAPKGLPADRRAWLVAALNAALDDQELQAEYKKTGAVLDRRIDTPDKVAAEVDKRANMENRFYVQQPVKQ